MFRSSISVAGAAHLGLVVLAGIVTEKYAHLAADFQEREADRLSLDVQVGLVTSSLSTEIGRGGRLLRR